ncbi:MAG: 3-deoxy-D-manno-octulosonic acid transferase [Candidatus Omnitrophica bacterium]|jgi:3-deoxy-D-manno-octulosonic-acid transferase|nr:3-deoxy-D-manno-octulosonic acid transferase [Candidatus Omnitrophota bacterium]
MFIVYDLIFLVFAVFSLPFYFMRGKFNSGFVRRLGFLPKGLNLERPIWVHAVSVGEVNAVGGLIRGLKREYPDKRIVVSTVTSTGNKVAREVVGEGDLLTYLPLDLSFIVRPLLKKINPCIFIIAETEIWPNLISALHKLSIPVVTVNGRISDHSYRGYRRIRFFIRPVLRMVDRFCVQSEADALRLEGLGVKKQKIDVTGNVKFDIRLDGLPEGSLYRDKLGLKKDEKLLVCGSTHPGEEEVILDSYRRVVRVFPGLRLLLAPRHPERSAEVSKVVLREGFNPKPVSGVDRAEPAGGKVLSENQVFILDTIGELFNYYSAADIVFVGGSLVKKGGHNILEPAVLRKPVIFGPQMFNFRQISRIFSDNRAAFLAIDAVDLADKVKTLLKDDILLRQTTECAYDLILKNRGATDKNIQVIKQLI